MKKLMMALLAMGLMTGGAGVARAEHGACQMCKEGKMDAGKKVDKLSLMLDLNDSQKAQVKKLVDAKMERLKPTMDKMKSEMDAAHNDFEAGLKKILNEKQAKKWEAMQKMKEDEHGH
jgi:hypothetical protein